jgi:hypothetical protein
MSTLVIHAPRQKVQPGGYWKSFERIFELSVGFGYAIASTLFAQLNPGDGVVLLDKDKRLRAEGKLVKLEPAGKAGNGVARYDVHIGNLKMVPYKPESLNRNGVAVI